MSGELFEKWAVRVAVKSSTDWETIMYCLSVGEGSVSVATFALSILQSTLQSTLKIYLCRVVCRKGNVLFCHDCCGLWEGTVTIWLLKGGIDDVH